MEHHIQLLKSIEYIEKNLKNRLEIEDISRVAALSKYHFQRVFQSLAGDPVSTYIRNRRLDLGFNELLKGEKSILDIALDYQFNSHEAFIRAFKKRYGITPSEARETKPDYKPYRKFSLDETDNSLESYKLTKLPKSGVIPEIIYGKERVIEASDYSISRYIIKDAKDLLKEDTSSKIYIYLHKNTLMDKYFIGTESKNHRLNSINTCHGKSTAYRYTGPPRRILTSLNFLVNYWLPREDKNYKSIIIEYKTNPVATYDYYADIIVLG